MTGKSLVVPPRDAGAEPICLLTREWAMRRAENPEAFLSIATSETPIDRGIEYRLPVSREVWSRIEVFVQEEGECCPFLAFEAVEEESQIRLQVIWPEVSDGL